MSLVPLLAPAPLDDIFAWRQNGPVSIADFLADTFALAARLPAGRHMLNLCQDRYRFTVGLAAGLISDRISLQPASQSPETLRQIQAASPDVFCLCDNDFDSLDLPRLDFPELGAVDRENIGEIPLIPANRTAVRLYTSGSTGTPVAHDKTWGFIVQSAYAEAERLGINRQVHHVVGTVPAQHSFGFESTVLLAMHAQAPFWAGKPFYPQDIVAALNAVPQPRMLVTTPFHLSALLAAGLELPPVALILSATAPLSAQLARDAEASFGAPLYEIYGSTETGQVASRQTTADQAWKLLPGVRLRQEEDVTFASGGHIEREIALSDVIEILPDGRFILHGRHADLINIAGKRTSLAYLNHQICAVPGVSDAAFFLPDELNPDGITRLCAFVVAPGLNSRQLQAELRQRVDPIFLPRPVVFMDALPRNSTGKLPRKQLLELFNEKVGHVER